MFWYYTFKRDFNTIKIDFEWLKRNLNHLKITPNMY